MLLSCHRVIRDMICPRKPVSAKSRHDRWTASSQRTGVIFAWCFLAVLVLNNPTSTLPAASFLLDSRTRIRNAALPICLDSGNKPIAILRAKEIFGDHQRRGFFRIGVLPLLVIDGMNVEIRDPRKLGAALEGVHREIIFKQSVRKAVEGRDFRLCFAPEEREGRGSVVPSLASSTESRSMPVLRAQIVRLDNSDLWRLEDGVVSRPGTPPITFHHATLQISGPKAGELSCETTNGVNCVSSLLIPSKT